MKKTFIIAALACIGVGFTSCSDKEQCWKVTYELGGTDVVTYQFATRDNIQILYGRYKDVEFHAVAKSKADCVLANAGLQTTK